MTGTISIMQSNSGPWLDANFSHYVEITVLNKQFFIQFSSDVDEQRLRDFVSKLIIQAFIASVLLEGSIISGTTCWEMESEQVRSFLRVLVSRSFLHGQVAW